MQEPNGDRSGRLNFCYIPERDALSGPTHGDNQRHVIVRKAFLRALSKDERLAALYQKWLADAELLEPWEWLQHVVAKAEQCSESIDITPAFDAYVRALNAFVLSGRTQPFADDAVAFTYALGLTWGWLPLELVQAFLIERWEQIYRVLYKDVRFEHPAEAAVAVRPSIPEQIVLTFRLEAGEADSVRRARIVGEALKAIDALAESDARRGTFPSLQIEKLERYAIWFYRRVVRGDSERAIAREHWPGEDRRSNVHYGVERARRLLDMGSYKLRHPG